MQRIMLYHILNTNLLHSIPTCKLLNVTKYIYVGADVVVLYLSMSTVCYFLLLHYIPEENIVQFTLFLLTVQLMLLLVTEQI